jgi:hypothetical protein
VPGDESGAHGLRGSAVVKGPVEAD